MRRIFGEIDTIGFVLGQALVVAGVALVFVPAAFVVCGVFIGFDAVAVTRSS